MRKTIIIIFLFSTHFFLNGQTALSIQTKPIPFEQINVVTDRDLYLSGEEIWFKATVNIDYTQKPFSQILYLELFNENQKSITRAKYRIKKGVAHGILNIPSEYLSGCYFLRAYTRYNKNFPSEYFFLSAIQIINPQTGLYTNSDQTIKDFKVNPNYSSVNDSQSKSVSFFVPKSFLEDDENPRLYIDSIEQKEAIVLKNGWAMTNFQAVEDKNNYNLVLINNKGVSLKKELKIEEKSSISLRVNRSTKGHHLVTLTPLNNSKKINNEVYTLELVDKKHQIKSSTEFAWYNSEVQLVIPNSNILKSDLYFFILKNEKKDIVKVFAFNSEIKETNPKTLTIRKTIRKRELFKIDLHKLTNENRKDIGVKVVPKGTVLSPINKLKFYIDNPILLFSYLRYQFDISTLSPDESIVFLKTLNSKLNDKRYIELFNPPQAKESKWIPEVRDIGLSGYLVNKKTQEAAPNIPVYLSVFRSFPQIHIYESRNDGSFIFSLNNFENNQDVFLCPLSIKADELELKVNMDYELEFPELNTLAPTVDSSDTKLLEQMLIASQTPKAYNVKSKNKDLSIGHLPYSFANPQLSIVLDDYVQTPTMEMVFKELVPNVKVRKKNNKYQLSIFDTEQELFYKDPLILVDEVPIFNIDELLKISPKVIEKIEVHKTPFILGDHTINGIIMIKTLTDDFGGMIMPKSSTFFEYQTVNPPYVFREKTYSTTEELKSRSADFRTLLYWNPLIKYDTDKMINFYTSDQTGEYEVYIFGNNKNGQAFHSKVCEFEVKE